MSVILTPLLKRLTLGEDKDECESNDISPPASQPFTIIERSKTIANTCNGLTLDDTFGLCRNNDSSLDDTTSSTQHNWGLQLQTSERHQLQVD